MSKEAKGKAVRGEDKGGQEKLEHKLDWYLRARREEFSILREPLLEGPRCCDVVDVGSLVPQA